jgi:hypothetical protein
MSGFVPCQACATGCSCDECGGTGTLCKNHRPEREVTAAPVRFALTKASEPAFRGEVEFMTAAELVSFGRELGRDLVIVQPGQEDSKTLPTLVIYDDRIES